MKLSTDQIQLSLIALVALFCTSLVWGIRATRGGIPQISNEPAKQAGPRKAPVYLLEFSDYACPHCADMNGKLKKVRRQVGSEFRIVFKHFPSKAKGRNSMEAAMAAECAAEQKKFWKFSDMLFREQGAWSSSEDVNRQFAAYAEKVGLNVPQFSECLESGRTRGRVERNRAEGEGYLVSMTPTLILNGRKILSNRETESIAAEVQKAIFEETAALRKNVEKKMAPK